MDLSGKEKVGVEGGDQGHLGYHHQMDPFFPTFWDQSPNLQPLGFAESTSVAWRPHLDTMPKGEALFLQPASGVPPTPSLPHLQADSAFIERAARFSCFGGIASPFGLNHSVDPYGSIAKNGANVGEVLVDAMDAANSRGYGGDQSGDAEISGQGENSNSKATKKRKRSPQSVETDQIKGESSNPKEAEKENADSERKVGENNLIPEQNACSSNLKLKGKQVNDGEDPPKADYIHVRARRGQATNSHSLAERVRREKISERMKFLQDLVPGCSKVTGKAVMLDEIINYVQSLQRQVEFLSMKLAAVNPQLELNIEGLLSKDMFQSHVAPSASIAFPLDLALPSLQQNQQALIKPVPSGIPPLDAHKGATSTQMAGVHAYGDSKLQIPNSWDGELHDTNQINLIGNPPLHIQDMNGETRSRFPT